MATWTFARIAEDNKPGPGSAFGPCPKCGERCESSFGAMRIEPLDVTCPKCREQFQVPITK